MAHASLTPSPAIAPADGTPVLLALDLGTTTGWALRAADGLIISGTVSLRPSRYDGGGMRYVRFRAWLERLAADAGPITAIHFEEGRQGRCRCLMAVYYNDADPAACAWLRELIAAKLLPDGEVDGRSILDVEPADLRGFAQCHFFAGIGGWPYALRLAGLAGDQSVWTGSPPCQPFSQAGQRKGQDDDRHLAPAFLRLVAACRPELVFGEQVASAAVLGPVGGTTRTSADGPAGWAWFDALAADLEAASYAVAAADLPAAGVSAPHIRQRLFFGAVALDPAAGGLGDSLGAGPQGRLGMPGRANQCAARPAGLAGGLADGNGGLARHGALQRGRQHRCEPQDGEAGGLVEGTDPAGTRATDGVWRDPDWLFCRDGRWRPVEPGTFPLADGLPGRMGLLRGYGNAIVPPLAAEFVTAFLESVPEELG